MYCKPLEGNEAREAARNFKASVAKSRIGYLESLPKPTKAEREQLARERETLARNN